MAIEMLGYEAHLLNLHTRMPFRFGITTLTACPHLFLRVEMAIDGQRVHGISADHLPPKWFTKNPQSLYRDDLVEMIRMIFAACDSAVKIGKANDVYSFWQSLYATHAAWGVANKLPPLLTAFGTSLVERSVIEGFCRASKISFGDGIRCDVLGFNLVKHYAASGRGQDWMAGYRPADLLPAQSLRSVNSRHTVGLADYLMDADIPDAERVTDGLPQSLEACISTYGLKFFKIKVSGDAQRDRARLQQVAKVISSAGARDFALTIDFNENFHEVEPLREQWNQLIGDPSLHNILSRLLFVEQPLHRDVALGDSVKRSMLAWKDRPPIIIDESDSSVTTMLTALESGYVGTSHKNCKGVFKSIANAMMIAKRHRDDPSGTYVLSSEDLTNIGPVSLQQDIAVAATIGIEQVERNGHHYFKGLSMLPDDLSNQALASHGDLFHRHPRGFVAMNVHGGRIDIGSVVDAPFGVGFEFDPSHFTPMDKWDFSSLGT